jgi:predicted phage-related endonuclease
MDFDLCNLLIKIKVIKKRLKLFEINQKEIENDLKSKTTLKF